MIPWMLWSTLLAITLGIAAMALERAAMGFGAPRRHIWTVALFLSVAVPGLLALRRTEITRVVTALPTTAQSQSDVVDETIAINDVATSLSAGPANRSSSALAIPSISLNRVVIALWIVASGLLAFAFGRSILQLRRRRRGWTNATVGTHSVLLSADDGPAVIGFARPTIVFPRWALALDAHSQEMMLRHETEHIRTGDPRVLLLAGVLLFALPWNVGLWWLVRRLRMAMELDCDARVIRSVGTSHEYGLMLLEVCERRPTMLPLASALASTRPLLERRIDAMSLPLPSRPVRAALPFVMIALIATTAAASAPRPASMRAPVIKLQEPVPARVTSPPTPARPAQVAPAVATPAVAGTAVAMQTPARAATATPQARESTTTAATPSLAQPTRANASAISPAAAAIPSTAAPATTSPATAAPAIATPANATAVPLFAPASPAPTAATAVPARKQKPNRAMIAALATQHARTVVRGDTAADYIILVLDASDRYVWSTHGIGSYAFEIAGDTRTIAERRQYSMENRAELLGTAVTVGGVGASGGGGGRGGLMPTMAAGGDSTRRLEVVSGSVRMGAGGAMSGRVLLNDTDSAQTRLRQSQTAAVGFGAGAARGVAGGGGRGGAGANDSAAPSRRVYYERDSMNVPRITARGGTVDTGRVARVMAAAAGAAISGGSGGAMAGGGGRGGGGFGGAINPMDSAAAFGTYSTRFISSRSPSLNTAWGLQESGNGQSGIQGLPSAALSSSDMYLFAAQELAPQMLRVLVVHLTPNTVWTHRF